MNIAREEELEWATRYAVSFLDPGMMKRRMARPSCGEWTINLTTQTSIPMPNETCESIGVHLCAVFSLFTRARLDASKNGIFSSA